MHKGEDNAYAAFVGIDWPTLPDAQRARRETLESFFHAGNVRRASTIDKRIKAIREERSLHSDEAVIGPARMLVEALLPQLRVLSTGIAKFEAEIARLAPQRPDYRLFDDLPGAGPIFAPRLLVAFGERRERFPTASSLQKSSGIAPVMERSGTRLGCTGDTLARNSSARLLSNGPPKPSRAPSGQKPSTNPAEPAAHVTKPRCTPWP
jgi:transposase